MSKKISVIFLLIFYYSISAYAQLSLINLPEYPSVNNYEHNASLKYSDQNNISNLRPASFQEDRISADPFGRSIRTVVSANLAYGIVTGNFVGEFDKQYSGLFGAHFNLSYLFSTTFMVTASTGYLSYIFKEDFPDREDYSFEVIPIMLGMKYIMSKSELKFYLMFQLGLHLLTSGRTIEFTSQTVQDSKTESRFGIHPGIGLMQKLSNNFLIDANIHYMLTSIAPANLSSLVFMVGAAYAFGE